MAARHRSKAEDRLHWHIPVSAKAAAHRAEQLALECFTAAADANAALGWLFSRFPELGAQGDDMVRHHLRLRSERYYQSWVLFCRRLGVSFDP